VTVAQLAERPVVVREVAGFKTRQSPQASVCKRLKQADCKSVTEIHCRFESYPAHMTIDEFAAKVEWEGGLWEAVTSYGLSEKDLDDDVDPAMYERIAKFSRKAKKVRELEYDLEDLLELDQN
jgi:hypothetical protein